MFSDEQLSCSTILQLKQIDRLPKKLLVCFEVSMLPQAY